MWLGALCSIVTKPLYLIAKEHSFISIIILLVSEVTSLQEVDQSYCCIGQVMVIDCVSLHSDKELHFQK